MFSFPYDWKQPYRWRTNLQRNLPWILVGWFGKGFDCEAEGGEHQWYNINNKNSGCYHCRVTREAQLWR